MLIKLQQCSIFLSLFIFLNSFAMKEQEAVVESDDDESSYSNANEFIIQNIPVVRQKGSSCGYHSLLNSLLSFLDLDANEIINLKFAHANGTWRAFIIRMRKEKLVKNYIKNLLSQYFNKKGLNDDEKRALDRIAHEYACDFVENGRLNILKENPGNLGNQLLQIIRRNRPSIDEREMYNISQCIHMIDFTKLSIAIAPANSLIKRAHDIAKALKLEIDLFGDNLDTVEMEALKGFILKEYGIENDCITIIDDTDLMNNEAYQHIFVPAKQQMLENNCKHAFCIRTSDKSVHSQQEIDRLNNITCDQNVTEEEKEKARTKQTEINKQLSERKGTHWISVTIDHKNGHNTYLIRDSMGGDNRKRRNVVQLVEIFEPSKQNKDNGKNSESSGITFEPFEPKESINYLSEQNNYSKNIANKLYGDTPVGDLDDIFDIAPPKAKNIVRKLNYPDKFFKGNCRFAILSGPPGVSKSTLSKAIAYRAGWECKFIVPMDVKREGRGNTAIQLRNSLMDVVNSKAKKVIVLDELNRLLENYNSEHHDTNETCDTLWTFLDAQIYNELIFVIATMNRVDKIPPQLKSRAQTSCIEIPPLMPQVFQNVISKKLLSNSAQFHQECTPEVVYELLLPFKSCSGRDLSSIADSAIEIFRRDDIESDIAIIEIKHLREALNDAIFARNTILKIEEKEDETEIERQERLHRESLTQSERLHKENFDATKKYHEEGIDKQDELFVQNAYLHLIMKSLERSEQINTGINGGINIGINPSLNLGTNNGTTITRQIVYAEDYEAIKVGWSDKQVRLLDAKLAEAQIRIEAKAQARQNKPTQKPQADQNKLAQENQARQNQQAQEPQEEYVQPQQNQQNQQDQFAQANYRPQQGNQEQQNPYFNYYMPTIVNIATTVSNIAIQLGYQPQVQRNPQHVPHQGQDAQPNNQQPQRELRFVLIGGVAEEEAKGCMIQ